VTEQSDIDWGKFDGFSWIRCSGKGNFISSPAVKQCAEHCLQGGARCIVIDLDVCTGMDSTFMGMLAGLAMRLTKQTGGGRLEIAGANEKNSNSLEDLGLDAFMEINPCGALWNPQIEAIRTQLHRWTGHPLGIRERSQEVLEAHQILSAANEENAKKFENVVQLLEKELGSESR
jgi:anti-sigma B factor antagonist